MNKKRMEAIRQWLRSKCPQKLVRHSLTRQNGIRINLPIAPGFLNFFLVQKCISHAEHMETRRFYVFLDRLLSNQRQINKVTVTFERCQVHSNLHLLFPQMPTLMFVHLHTQLLTMRTLGKRGHLCFTFLHYNHKVFKRDRCVFWQDSHCGWYAHRTER